MNPWYFRCRSVTARKVLRWFHDTPGIMHLWLVWWMWCWHRNAVEGLWRPEGVNILKGRVRAKGMEWSHMAVENIGEQRRMLGMKFYVTTTFHSLPVTCHIFRRFQPKYTTKHQLVLKKWRKEKETQLGPKCHVWHRLHPFQLSLPSIPFPAMYFINYKLIHTIKH